MGDLNMIFISTQVNFTLGNHFFSSGNYTLVKLIPGYSTKGNLTRVFMSTKVILTLGNLILSLGIYILVKFTPGNPTKSLTPGIKIYPG